METAPETVLFDLQVDEDTDLRWQELVKTALGPEAFQDQCTHGGTSTFECNVECVARNLAWSESDRTPA
jgi:hypothetical protein